MTGREEGQEDRERGQTARDTGQREEKQWVELVNVHPPRTTVTTTTLPTGSHGGTLHSYLN